MMFSYYITTPYLNIALFINNIKYLQIINWDSDSHYGGSNPSPPAS